MRILRYIRAGLVAAAVSAAMLLNACGEIPDQYAYDEEAPSLREAYADYFKVGAAINSWNLEDPESPEYKTIAKQFSVLTLENESKPENLHPEEDRYYFDKFDLFVDFCEDHDISPRGHTLLWHSQVPDWFFRDNGHDASAELVLSRIKEHVTTIVSRYKGRVKTWDVVNEVIGDDGPLRQSEWLRLVGDYDGDGDDYDYIETAFIAAHEADPDARLIINDYSLETSSSKAIRMYNAVKKMLDDGVPISGVGFQMHIGNGVDLDAMRENYRIISRLRDDYPEFVIEVTELDVNCYPWNAPPADVEVTKELLEQFSKTYTDVFTLFKELSEDGLLDSVVMWGLHDGVSWLNNGHSNYPMLITKELKLKPAFYDVIKLAE